MAAPRPGDNSPYHPTPNGDIFSALDDDGRLWGEFWINQGSEDGRLSISAPVKGDNSNEDVTTLLWLSVVQTTAVLAIDLSFFQPSKGMRGSTKTGEERWTDLVEMRSLDLTFAGRVWGRLVVEAGRLRLLDPKDRTRLELIPTTETTSPFTLRRGNVPVLRVAAFGPDGQALWPTTVYCP